MVLVKVVVHRLLKMVFIIVTWNKSFVGGRIKKCKLLCLLLVGLPFIEIINNTMCYLYIYASMAMLWNKSKLVTGVMTYMVFAALYGGALPAHFFLSPQCFLFVAPSLGWTTSYRKYSIHFSLRVLV